MFGKIWLLSLLIWHFMSSGIFFQFDARNHTVVALLVLRATLVLPLSRVSLLKLFWQGTKIVLPSRACFLARLGLDLYGSPPPTAKAAVQESQLWNCYQLALSKMVLNRDCAVRNSEVQSCRHPLVYPRGFRIVLGKIWLSHC